MCLLAILVLKHSRIASSSSLPHVCQLELPCPWLSDSPGSSGIISLSVSLFDGLGELRKIFWSDSEVLAAFFNSCLIGLNFSAVFGLSLIRSAKSFFKWAWSLCTAEKSSLSERCWTYTINFARRPLPERVDLCCYHGWCHSFRWPAYENMILIFLGYACQTVAHERNKGQEPFMDGQTQDNSGQAMLFHCFVF